jgi:hypothetical protein
MLLLVVNDWRAFAFPLARRNPPCYVAGKTAQQPRLQAKGAVN